MLRLVSELLGLYGGEGGDRGVQPDVSDGDGAVQDQCELHPAGATYSELTTPMYTEAVVDALFKRVPMKEIAQPEWIARGVVFLASDDSRYMTGEVIVMDGGYRMDGSLPDAAYWKNEAAGMG